jgi:hypothetical protein
MSDVSETTGPQGVVRRKSPWSEAETVERLVAAIEAAGATVFTTVDHSGEAERVGRSLRQTKVLVFGNPAAGTLLMQVQPLVALDLPLKMPCHSASPRLGGRAGRPTEASTGATVVPATGLVVGSACPVARGPRRRAQSSKAGMTSVPMSSMVCMTDSWEIL